MQIEKSGLKHIRDKVIGKWRPNEGGVYYTATADPERGFYVAEKIWTGSDADNGLLCTNLVFKTPQEAEDFIDKTLAFILSRNSGPVDIRYRYKKLLRGLKKVETKRRYTPKYYPKRDQLYYTLGYVVGMGYVTLSRIWFDGMVDRALLKANLVFKKKEEADSLLDGLRIVKETAA